MKNQKFLQKKSLKLIDVNEPEKSAIYVSLMAEFKKCTVRRMFAKCIEAYVHNNNDPTILLIRWNLLIQFEFVPINKTDERRYRRYLKAEYSAQILENITSNTNDLK